MKTTLKLAAIAVLMTGVAACDVDVEDEGEMPSVSLEGGEMPDVSVDGGELPEADVEGELRMPEIEIETPDVEIGTTETTVPVPEVEMNETAITLPDVDIEMPNDDPDSQDPASVDSPTDDDAEVN